MNTTKVIYAAGGIAAVAIAVFFIMGMGNFRFSGNSDAPDVDQTQLADLQLGLEDIVVERTDDRDADVQVAFDVYNPNRSTAILETIHYALYVDEFQMTTGEIGESPEGFVAGLEDTFPIVADTAVTLRDTQVAVRNNLTASSWDNMIDGTAQYLVEGRYVYRLIGSDFQTSYYEEEFALTFP